MKNIAIIAPCILPVPAIKGGAVETLLEYILEENEIEKGAHIDFFSLYDERIDTSKFSQCTFYWIKEGKIVHSFDSFIDKFNRHIFRNYNSVRLLDNAILKVFEKRIAEMGEKRYDAIVFENQASTAVKLMNCIKGIEDSKLFFHIHNDIDIYRSPDRIQCLGSRGVTFVAVSKYIQKQVSKWTSSTKNIVLYNGIDERIFNRGMDSNKESIRKEIGAGVEDIIFLLSGRVIRQKGFLEAIRAMSRFCHDYPELKKRVHLVLVGFSNEKNAYEQIVYDEASKYSKYIHCVNRISSDKMSHILEASDVVLVPTLDEEPFGLVALEAFAMGKPVIATKSGGLSEYVTDDRGALVDKSGDLALSLSIEMKKLCDDEIRNRCGENAYRFFISHSEFCKKGYYHNFMKVLNEG